MVMLSSGAGAADRYFGDRGGFEIYGDASTRDKPGSCWMEKSYEGAGSTQQYISWNVTNDIIYVGIVNLEWSAQKDKEYEIDIGINDGTYERTALGFVNGGYKGFIAGLPRDEFLSDLAKSTYFHVYLRDGTVIDRLSLSGSAAAVVAYKQCVAWVSQTERAAQAERDRFKDIPRDPFKNAEPKPATDSNYHSVFKTIKGLDGD